MCSKKEEVRADPRMSNCVRRAKETVSSAIHPIQTQDRGDLLILYLTMSKHAISDVLAREEHPVHYTSKAYMKPSFDILHQRN